MPARLPLGLVLLLVLLSHPGCKPAIKPIRTVKAITQTTPIEFTFPEDWIPNPDEHPFDLQWQDKQLHMTTGVFAMHKEDIPDGSSVPGLYELQIDDLRGKRDNFTTVKAAQVQERDGKKLTTTVFQGEKGGEKYYYRFTLIEFLRNDSKFAIVMQNSFPEHWNENEPVFEMITNSARALDEMPASPASP